MKTPNKCGVQFFFCLRELGETNVGHLTRSGKIYYTKVLDYMEEAEAEAEAEATAREG